MPNYTTADEMATRLGNISPNSESWTVLMSAIDAAEAAVEDYCGRVFTLQTSATALTFCPADSKVLETGDFGSTSGLIVADTFGTHTTYQLEPLNGIGPNNRPWPYTRIRLALDFFAYPIWPGQATVTITARWGWPSVPVPVKDACRILAADLYHMKDNQFGVAGFGEMGVLMVRENRMVANLLALYRYTDNVFGIA
jgi:hypothetical protein